MVSVKTPRLLKARPTSERASHVANGPGRKSDKQPRRRAAGAKYSRKVVSLLSQRDALMDEIGAMLGGPNESSALARKAGTLLTRHWAGATWDAREEILQSARWLVSVSRIQSALSPRMAPDGAAPPRRGMAKSGGARPKPAAKPRAPGR
jgi:hypothetical protein